MVKLLAVGLSFAGLVFPTAGQGLRTVIESRDKVFPAVGAGVTAIKRDSSGRYYVLAKPETVISVYGSDGAPIGQIPNANSGGATIRYAADIDLNPDGFLVVADRGANAIEVFAPNGSLVSKTPVIAPTSVVALPDGLFAVTSLTSKRLVEVVDQRGKVLRSFGDPADVGDQSEKEQPDKEPLVNRGKISGDSSGAIYFAFTSVPDPTVRKYDRYGYVGYEAALPAHVFGEGPNQPNDRVQVSFGFSDASFYDQASAFITLGSSNDVQFGGGVGSGFGEALRRGGGFGQVVQQQNGTGGGGPFGALFSGQVTSQGSNFQLSAGPMSGFGGRGRGRGGFGTVSDQTNAHGASLEFNSSGSDYGANGDTPDFTQALSNVDGSNVSAELQSGPFDANSSGTPDASSAYTGTPLGSGLGPGGLPASFVIGTTLDNFRPERFQGALGTPPTGAGSATAGTGSTHSTGAGTETRTGAGTGTHGATGFSRGGYRGRYGSTSFGFTGNMRVNLGDLGRVSAFDKPIITAMAADPENQGLWAGIGDTLVHFSKDGEPAGIYYLTLNGGTPLKPAAVLVEPDRILIAADPWGIFEFARPDKIASAPNQQLNVVPQVVPQPH